MRQKQWQMLLAEALQQRPVLVLVLVGLLLVALLFWQSAGSNWVAPRPAPGPSTSSGDDDPSVGDTTPLPAPRPGNYLFCFWNVENLFDDKDDGRKTKGDKEYDGWYANNKEARDQKLKHLCDVLIPLNEGKGPDILAVCEIESDRAADLLRQALNRRLNDPKLRYPTMLYLEGSGGRNIAPAIITRLPVESDRTQLLDKRMRILEGHVKVVGQPLVILASHWTSRISDKTGDRRSVYGDRLYGRYRQMLKSNPRVDFLVCGDFNDNPDDPSVKDHLHASGDREAVRAGGAMPLLFNLFAKPWQDGEASHYYGTRPYLFDQICVSPGLLDREGWSCDVSSAQVVKQLATRQGRPNRFGGENDKRSLEVRGASDHFPIIVQLRVQGQE
jgi:endonuclease/exonuclease/phosphatase family metal-dependent hydrolase